MLFQNSLECMAACSNIFTHSISLLPTSTLALQISVNDVLLESVVRKLNEGNSVMPDRAPYLFLILS